MVMEVNINLRSKIEIEEKNKMNKRNKQRDK